MMTYNQVKHKKNNNMSKFVKIGLIGFVFLFFSCGKNEEGIITLKIGKVTEIKLGETAENTQKGLSLRVDGINDSRCPKGAQCVWEGSAYVEFHLTTEKEKYNFTLETHPYHQNDTVIEGIKYELIDVLPYPDLNKKQPVKKVKVLVE
jgi:hypothetical protein